MMTSFPDFSLPCQNQRPRMGAANQGSASVSDTTTGVVRDERIIIEQGLVGGFARQQFISLQTRIDAVDGSAGAVYIFCLKNLYHIACLDF